MQADHSLFIGIYQEAKFWGPFIAFLWGVFKVVDWVKQLKTNDLHHIQLGINNFSDELKNQTVTLSSNQKAVIDELKAMREDFRTYYKP